MADTPDTVMLDGEATPLPDDQSDILAAAETSTGPKSLPASIIPPNKASTAPTQEIIDRFAPGSAPHWVGAAAFGSKDSNGDKVNGSNSGPAGYVKG